MAGLASWQQQQRAWQQQSHLVPGDATTPTIAEVCGELGRATRRSPHTAVVAAAMRWRLRYVGGLAPFFGSPSYRLARYKVQASPVCACDHASVLWDTDHAAHRPPRSPSPQRYLRKRSARAEGVRRILGCAAANQVPRAHRPPAPPPRTPPPPRRVHRPPFWQRRRAGPRAPAPAAAPAPAPARAAPAPAPAPATATATAPTVGFGRNGRPWRRWPAGVCPTVVLIGNAKFAVATKGSPASATRQIVADVGKRPTVTTKFIDEYLSSSVRLLLSPSPHLHASTHKHVYHRHPSFPTPSRLHAPATMHECVDPSTHTDRLARASGAAP